LIVNIYLFYINMVVYWVGLNVDGNGIV
jgi:hypothetical protein